MNAGDLCAIATLTFSRPPRTGFAGLAGMTFPFDGGRVNPPWGPNAASALTMLGARHAGACAARANRLCAQRQGRAMNLLFDTARVTPRDRAGFWREVVCSVYVPMDA